MGSLQIEINFFVIRKHEPSNSHMRKRLGFLSCGTQRISFCIHFQCFVKLYWSLTSIFIMQCLQFFILQLCHCSIFVCQVKITVYIFFWHSIITKCINKNSVCFSWDFFRKTVKLTSYYKKLVACKWPLNWHGCRLQRLEFEVTYTTPSFKKQGKLTEVTELGYTNSFQF